MVDDTLEACSVDHHAIVALDDNEGCNMAVVYTQGVDRLDQW